MEEDIPTATSEPDVIVLRATLPTPLIPPTADETEIAELLATPPPRATEPVTWTPAPTEPRGEFVLGPATTSTPDDPPTQDAGFIFNPDAERCDAASGSRRPRSAAHADGRGLTADGRRQARIPAADVVADFTRADIQHQRRDGLSVQCGAEPAFHFPEYPVGRWCAFVPSEPG